MALEIMKAGPMTTIQDRGRKGFMHRGFRECGACDKYAMRLANILAGNLSEQENSAVLEFTLQGSTVRFTEDTVIALTGADMQPKLDGEYVAMFCTLPVRKGQVLTLGMTQKGLRTYLAVRGGILVPEVMGSRSTDMKCRIGGLEGRMLQAGDVVPIGKTEQTWFQNVIQYQKELCVPEDLFWLRSASFRYRSVGMELIPVLRIVAGPQEDYFSEEVRKQLQRGIYQVSAQSDRMACRLDGPVLEALHGYDIISDGIVEGSVQVSANGQPMVMLSDHQTTGGYAKIGTVISADIPAIAQRRPGEKIGFLFVTPQEANAAYRVEEKKLEWFRLKIKNLLEEKGDIDAFCRFEL